MAAAAGCSAAGPDEGWDVGEAELAVQACPPEQTVLGIDIASYQHPNGASIDWGTVAQHRRFVVVKATEGTGYTNDYYADDVAGARAAGMVAGAYHWLHYTSSGAEQAQHFLSAVGNVPPGDLPPMLDVEETNDDASPGERVAIMKDFLDTIEQAIGRKPMIYSGSWYWGPYMGSPGGYAGVYPMVWAAYVDGCPNVPDDFAGITMWQYLGGEGSTPGIDAPCDQDMFYGSEADLLALANGGFDYGGESLGKSGQSYPIVSEGAVEVEEGNTVTGWVKLKNTGKQRWEPGTVWLAPIPRDQPHPLRSPSWANDHRISTVETPVEPGEVGEFALDITGGGKLGETILELGWVAEGITWFSDPPKGGGPPDGYFAVKVDVLADTDGTTAGVGGGGTTGVGGDGGDGFHSDSPEADDSGCSCRQGASAPARGAPTALLVAGFALAALAKARTRRRRAEPG